MKDFRMQVLADHSETYANEAEQGTEQGGHYAIAAAILMFTMEFRLFRQELMFGTPEDGEKGILEKFIIDFNTCMRDLTSAVTPRDD